MRMAGFRIELPFLRSIYVAFEKQFMYLGLKISARKYVMNTLIFSLVLGLIAIFLGITTFNLGILFSILAGIGTVVGMIGVMYMLLDLSADGRGKKVEAILPDALQLIASNIKSGLTTERALLMSARPEFGPLETELRRVSAKIYSGTPVEHAILEIPKHLKSTLVERTTWLLARGISSGGEIADLLMQLSHNLRKQLALQSEASASISIYVILIFFSAAFGGPALYAVSSFIVEVMTAQTGATPAVDPGAIASAGSRFAGLSGFVGGKASIISPDFIVFFSQVMLFVGGVFASLILGAIATGKEKDGMKYLPVMLLVSFGLFFLIRAVMHAAFGPLLLNQ